ncbi:putative sugar phosphate/phosphate translocator [Tetrabaena socialis]|uniref:Putative sugar phosphate/phosphate translocator n=1 Tax=Tetrabaena socialis TaxID=47790 RepID=A0A2J7ZH25_9CHLO|nr:putative sugar phosphate/phosphate translocator [Tetrabaena socialis]|eukprot:PNG99547.1 putative sugar phosphate/phosphate translocator [Tetrabaena socialis]
MATKYFYLTIAFIEMSRASVPITTMIALWVARLEIPTTGIIRAVSVTGIGSAIAAFGEVHLSSIGAFIVIANLTMESVRLAMTQYMLTGLDMHPLHGLKYIAPAASLTLGIGAILTELPIMLSNGSLETVQRYPILFLLAASLGLAVNILGMVIMKLSSATTLKVLSAVRGPIVVLSGVLLFAEGVTATEFVGYSMASSIRNV